MINLRDFKLDDATLGLPPVLPDPVEIVTKALRAAAQTAILKTEVSELTETEKVALAYYAGVPFTMGDMREPSAGLRLTTVPCGFYHDGEKWIVAMRAEDER